MIYELKINGLKPTNFISCEDMFFSFKSDNVGDCIASIYENGKEISSVTVSVKDRIAFSFPIKFGKEKKYKIELNFEKEKEIFEFETAPDLDEEFITPKEKIFAPVAKKTFYCEDTKDARFTVTALGLYRAFINGKRVGDDFLTPGFNDYDAYLRYKTYDVGKMLKKGNNEIEIYLGDGWYKGRIGIDKAIDKGGEVYGNEYLLCCKLTQNGEKILVSDTTWKFYPSGCLENSIYDGEVWDFNKKGGKEIDSVCKNVNCKLIYEFNEPIKIKEILTPKLIISDKGEKILDFGQNATGFVRCRINKSDTEKLEIYHGEVLQNGCFYNGNLRTAKARMIYYPDGKERVLEPYFSYFGFRYAKIEGIDDVDENKFEMCVIYSDIDKTCECVTDNEKINRLIQNSVWGQRSNFLDIPTDCPQRDERLGWTADIRVFSKTASYQTDSKAFLMKYLTDLRNDQIMYYSSEIPMYSPSLKGEAGEGGAGWSDVCTELPYNLYTFYGDKNILFRSYPMMHDYVEKLIEKSDNNLIKTGFTFGDWLAQDGMSETSLKGGTDDRFIMSVFYFISTEILSKTSRIIGLQSDFEKYSEIANEIKEAILYEYFSPSGRLCIDTQTAYFLSLEYGIYKDKYKVIEGLKNRLKKDFFVMKTGFLGTPICLKVLFDCGMDNDAYRMLYREKFPSWLYCVNLGATTVWERWNSLNPDGKISGISMNSLNHYAYGSVCETIYSRIVGLETKEAGFLKSKIEPHPNYRMKNIRFEFNSPYGKYRVSWKTENGNFVLFGTVPTVCECEIIMPNGETHTVKGGDFCFSQNADFEYPFDENTPNIDLVENEKTREKMKEIIPNAYKFLTGENKDFLSENMEVFHLPMFFTPSENADKFASEIKRIKP